MCLWYLSVTKTFQLHRSNKTNLDNSDEVCHITQSWISVRGPSISIIQTLESFNPETEVSLCIHLLTLISLPSKGSSTALLIDPNRHTSMVVSLSGSLALPSSSTLPDSITGIEASSSLQIVVALIRAQSMYSTSWNVGLYSLTMVKNSLESFHRIWHDSFMNRDKEKKKTFKANAITFCFANKGRVVAVVRVCARVPVIGNITIGWYHEAPSSHRSQQSLLSPAVGQVELSLVSARCYIPHIFIIVMCIKPIHLKPEIRCFTGCLNCGKWRGSSQGDTLWHVPLPV